MTKTVNQLIGAVKGCHCIRIVLTIFLAVLFLSQFSNVCYVQAAAKEYGRLENNTSDQVKSGKYYYTFNSDGLYISDTNGVKGVHVLPSKRNGAFLSTTVYLSKRYIYYTYSKKKSISVYRRKLDGTGEKKLASTKSAKFDSFEGKTYIYLNIEFVYYDRYVMLQSNLLEIGRTYSVDIKSKKIKLIALNGVKHHIYLDFTYCNPNSYQCYYVATGRYMSVTDINPVYVYNVKKKAFLKLEDNARGIAFGGKYIYYIEYHMGDRSGKLYRCDVKGKNKKLICSLNTKSDNGPMLVTATNKYCIYYVWYYGGAKTEYYKYTFSTKKTKKIKYNPAL